MFFPSRAIVESVKKNFPPGTEIELIIMEDPYTRIPPGTRGVVEAVDDTATVHVAWSTGHHLGLVYGEDIYRKVKDTQ